MKVRGILLFVAGLLVGGLVIPAAAQTDPAENQLVIRSDGFIFLLRGAQRHLVSPVALSDEEINGYPEGEPFLSGLVPVEAQSAAPAGTFGGTALSGSATRTPTPNSSATSTPTPRAGSSGSSATATSTPKAANSSSSSSGQITASFKKIPSNVEQNETLKVVIEAPDGSTCEGKIQFKGGKSTAFTPGTTAKSECNMQVVIPDDAREGDADVKATVKMGTESTNFEDVVMVFAAGRRP
jgi:hypothetical protein